MDNGKYFDVDSALAEYGAALVAAWTLIGWLDGALEKISSPHLSAKAKREMIANARAKIQASVAGVERR